MALNSSMATGGEVGRNAMEGTGEMGKAKGRAEKAGERRGAAGSGGERRGAAGSGGKRRGAAEREELGGAEPHIPLELREDRRRLLRLEALGRAHVDCGNLRRSNAKA